MVKGCQLSRLPASLVAPCQQAIMTSVATEIATRGFGSRAVDSEVEVVTPTSAVNSRIRADSTAMVCAYRGAQIGGAVHRVMATRIDGEMSMCCWSGRSGASR